MTRDRVEALQKKNTVPKSREVHSKETHCYENVQSHKETLRVTKSEGRALTTD
jgi:hypothetical protein